MGIQEEIDSILDEWDEDSHIDELNIQSESLRTANLHSKYLRDLKKWKGTKLALQIRYDELKGKKIKYWKGEFSKEELKEFGWPQWRFKTPLKSEIETYIESDKDLNRIKMQSEAVTIGIEVLESIIKQIGQRDFEISSYIKMKMFNKGDDY